jgi:PadR family transcriptional regulator PadR
MGGGPGWRERHTPLTLALLEPALLVLLKEQPRHGYTLLPDLVTLGMGTIHPSVVYRILREMEELGWVESDWETDQTQGPPRRIYKLTAQGEDVLENWKLALTRSRDLITQLLDRIQKRKEL